MPQLKNFKSACDDKNTNRDQFGGPLRGEEKKGDQYPEDFV
jgi:hypothetical protein